MTCKFSFTLNDRLLPTITDNNLTNEKEWKSKLDAENTWISCKNMAVSLNLILERYVVSQTSR